MELLYKNSTLRDLDDGTVYPLRNIDDGNYRVALTKPFHGLNLKATNAGELRKEMEILHVSAGHMSPAEIEKIVNNESKHVRAVVVATLKWTGRFRRE